MSFSKHYQMNPSKRANLHSKPNGFITFAIMLRRESLLLQLQIPSMKMNIYVKGETFILIGNLKNFTVFQIDCIFKIKWVQKINKYICINKILKSLKNILSYKIHQTHQSWLLCLHLHCIRSFDKK